MIEIIVSDDGKGINIENLLQAAIKSGNLPRDAAGKLNREEILSLIFQQGVTTSSIITDLSGRGIGLSIVREKVEKLHGRVMVETDEIKGTTFIILLPMTLATFRGVLVKSSEYQFIVPTMNVDRVLEAKPEMIKTIENHETIMIDDQILPLTDLAEVLGIIQFKIADSSGLKTGLNNSDKVSIIVVASGNNRIAIKVDAIIEEVQILVKGLGKLLKHVRNISGATILGSGKVVPVLQITDLIKSALKSSERIKNPPTPERKVERIRNILVAEDSITARTLLKNILEAAGYGVSTAVDGSEAFMRLRSKEFDLVVSDIDMPGLNGFELTQKIRDDKKLSETPVVLVTALESREDRERGIEVGANAYIIKSSFDQTNLLQIIKKLI
jgi:two-component system chemotaxis sensor kinase CheA